jgi:hypothetical protein
VRLYDCKRAQIWSNIYEVNYDVIRHSSLFARVF